MGLNWWQLMGFRLCFDLDPAGGGGGSEDDDSEAGDEEEEEDDPDPPARRKAAAKQGKKGGQQQRPSYDPDRLAGHLHFYGTRNREAGEELYQQLGDALGKTGAGAHASKIELDLARRDAWEELEETEGAKIPRKYRGFLTAGTVKGIQEQAQLFAQLRQELRDEIAKENKAGKGGRSRSEDEDPGDDYEDDDDAEETDDVQSKRGDKRAPQLPGRSGKTSGTSDADVIQRELNKLKRASRGF